MLKAAPASGRVGRRLRMLARLRPATPNQLHRFVEVGLGLSVPRVSVSGVGLSPFDYLRDSYFGVAGDSVVWASRGGGKTMLGAAATLLELLFYPGIQVRVLGGSLDQSEKMYGHLRSLLGRDLFHGGGGVLAGEPTARRIALLNGSEVQLLAASQRSVRGTRVHVLRCDEVEEMDPRVWSAAQLVTRSQVLGGRLVNGKVEAFSTMHRPMGLMAGLIAEDALSPRPGRGAERAADAIPPSHPASTQDAVDTPGQSPGLESKQSPGLTRRVYRWNALDVVERCPPTRPCKGCVLWEDCGGRARKAGGFFPVADLIQQRVRVSDAVWEAEMMCRRPRVSDCVYPAFSRDRHVMESPGWLAARGPGEVPACLGGMDFGMRSPTTLLWAFAPGRGADAPLHVVAEYSATDRTVENNLAAAGLVAMPLGLPTPEVMDALAVDPAGHQRSGQTGHTHIQALRHAGCTVVAPRAPIAAGVEAVRRRLDHGGLTIHPRCTGLIGALSAYHFDTAHPGREQPVKDGPDHLCDALRYLVLAQDRGGGAVTARSY